MSSFKDSVTKARLCGAYKRSTLAVGFSLVLSTFSTNLFAACEYIIDNQWNSGFQASIKISNTTTSAINGWSVAWQYNSGDRVTHSWNNTLSGSNPYNATNLSWNATIQPGQSVTFGFQGTKSAGAAEIPLVTGAACSDVTSSRSSSSSSLAPSSSSSSSIRSSSFSTSVSSSVMNTAGQCNWYGTLYPLCTGTASEWGWENNASCISRSTCVSQPPPYGVVGGSSSSSSAPSSNSSSSNSIISNSSSNSSNSSNTSNTSNTSSSSASGLITWDLDATQSFINLVTTKNTHNVEAHRFDTLSGNITDLGEASFIIDLASINTGNATRDTRMRSLLFETGSFPVATVTVPLDMDLFSELATGSSMTMSISANLNLHGVDKLIQTTVLVQRLSNSRVMVQNTKPLFIKAIDHSLEAGVEALRSVANLTTVSTTVPVDFVLFFDAR